jgi:hypothetical protein
MVLINFCVGWLGILAGLAAGTLLGLFFHNEGWLEGYGSWQRRMLRLGHVALVGTGLLNLVFALSVDYLDLGSPPCLASVLFLVGAATMPAICFLSAWRQPFRHLFFIPVVSLVVASGDFIFHGLVR